MSDVNLVQPSSAFPSLAGDRFEIVGELGEGGMATVYRAVDRETAEWCAIKVLHPKYFGRAKVRMRFAAEAQAMLRLRHRNVIHVIDVNTESPKFPFFAMELAEGGCVVEWLAQYGPMPSRMAVNVAIQVCKGLGAAHRQGVIHRDVKPHNVLVNRRGVCKITDFGIAQIDDEDNASLTRTGSVMGTLGYIAPEQRANAKDVDETADVYSVGATLYTMVTGRTTMDLFFADQEPAMMEGVPKALQPIIMKATRYRREDRHTSMRDLAKDLYHVKSDLPEDPADTPSLVMRNVAADTHELARITTNETTFDHSNSGEQLPISPTFGDQYQVGDTTTPGSSPGIPRHSLLRGATDPGSSAGVAATSRRVRTLLLSTSPLLVLLFILAGLAASGRVDIEQRNTNLASSQAAVIQAFTEERDVVSELALLGADKKVIQKLWALSKSPAHSDMIALVSGLRDISQNHQPIPGSDRMHIAKAVEQRIDRLEAAAEVTRRNKTLRDSAYATAKGRLAVNLRLAPPP
jgi:serine/threonine protein kinase